MQYALYPTVFCGSEGPVNDCLADMRTRFREGKLPAEATLAVGSARLALKCHLLLHILRRPVTKSVVQRSPYSAPHVLLIKDLERAL